LATSGVDERAVKQARIAVAMSRAQFNKSIRAFGSPPTAEQHARLSQLHQELESADEALARLLDASQESPAP
jgi:electron transport complex protein RnfB